jgi:hypothetical protein
MVNDDWIVFLIYFRYLGEPYFEKQKPYPQYHRSRKERLRRNKNRKSSKISYTNLSTKIKSNNIENDHIHQNLKRRAKRQLDFDPTAKHVEVLVAYDESIKHFHSDADIKSYILTLFSYVSLFFFLSMQKYLNSNSSFRCHIYILMQVLVIILKYGLLN